MIQLTPLLRYIAPLVDGHMTEMQAAKGPPRVGSETEAAEAAEYVIARVKAASGQLFHQGLRLPPLPCTTKKPALRFFAEQRLHRVSTSVARALVAWGDGFPVELLTEIPRPSHVLLLQARGERCVSLLPDGASTGHHADTLAFALHDLCHLDKFIDPAHHLGQLGFFACLHQATRGGSWASFAGAFDEAFQDDWHHVAADMNGSAVFLFATLKMKLKMAVRRRCGIEKNRPPIERGPLRDDELLAYDAALGDLVSRLGLSPSAGVAASAISTKRDDREAALALLRYFEEVGKRVASSVDSRRD